MPKEEGSLPSHKKIPSVGCYPAHFSRYLTISEVFTSSEFPSLLVTVITRYLFLPGITSVNTNKVLYCCSLRQGWFSSGYLVLSGSPKLSVALTANYQ